MEMGADFYGAVRYALLVQFGDDREIIHMEKVGHFAIDKATATAYPFCEDYWNLFRKEVDICCCEGWVHEAEKRDTFSKIET
ncbi:hypothetical protein B0H17DRAFT_1205938 [Mycena rosella]|uniref:Uncharacterized protein n=1 Tax=Mycena rosella TaxID=1033263 RepID=A0AAD7D9P5_MYCRO|nr:hypothetical protein B0H17DRAFT_1205938 [Mycena rosella]